jgi:hypothetical protein
MKTIKVYASVGLVGCKVSTDIKVEDDASEEEINDLAFEVLFELVNWGWEEKTS